MSRESITSTVQTIFRDVLDQPMLAINDNLTASDVRDWDSLSHITLIAAIEKQYSIRFSLGELDSFQNIGQLIDMIEAKITR